jgi:surface polysaccharide O-acyltransferase-like enzyme
MIWLAFIVKDTIFHETEYHHMKQKYLQKNKKEYCCASVGVVAMT